MSSYPCAVPGINLDRWVSPGQNGWGAPCAVQLATVQLSEARVSVHVALAELVGLIMRANEAQGYHYRRADTGAYNCRANRNNPNASSWHSWGVAIDSNWQTNPMRFPVVTDRPGWEIQRWNRYGFGWGGDYDPSNPPDAMHTEFHGTPAQAQAALVLARAELSELAGQAPGSVVVPVVNTGGGGGGGWRDIPLGGVTELHTHGEQVRRDQADLIDSGFPVGASGADGYAGDDTVAAIKAAQFALKVAVDGAMGPVTRDTLHRIPSYGLTGNDVWGPITGPAWQHGGINDYERGHVAALQGQLIRKGCVAGKSNPDTTTWDDGKYEDATTAAVRTFQSREGITVDGLVGATTWTRLFL